MKRFLLIMLFLVLVLTITNVLYGAVQGWGSCTISIDCETSLGYVMIYCWTPQCNGPHCNSYGGSVECYCDDGFYRSMDCPAMEVPEEWERC